MKIERTKNAARGILAGMLLKVCMMVLPLLMRTAMIYLMGVKYLGLNGLFTSILHTLNLAEMGVGMVMVYGMYKPIAEDDTSQISALLNLYRKYYRIIGLVIAVAGVLLTPVIPKLITGEIPSELNIYVLYYLNLAATVMTYWLYAYKKSLLQAHQRVDILSLISVLTNVVQYVVQFLVLYFTRDYYLYVLVLMATMALNNVVSAIVVDKKYPDYKPRGTLPKTEIKKINQSVRDLVTGKVGNVVLKSVDTIVISAYMGLDILAIYQNYYFILTSISNIFEIILSSLTAGLGNSIVVETKQKNYRDLKVLSLMFTWLTGVSTCCLLGMYQPFMMLWVGQELMLEYGIVICFAVYFYVLVLNRLLNIYKDAAGIWHQDRFRPLIAAIVNLTLNLLLIRRWGLYGILLSTVIAIGLVEIPWVMWNLFKYMFSKVHLKEFVLHLLGNIGATALSGTIIVHMCKYVQGNNLVTLIVCAAISAVIPNVIFYLVYRKDEAFKESCKLVFRLIKRRKAL